MSAQMHDLAVATGAALLGLALGVWSGLHAPAARQLLARVEGFAERWHAGQVAKARRAA